ncbi:hypothetical protein [Enterobacter bugandensis]|uniref:hypothetical protein n=1 Tax=Enterobacter bugandensis TaxID=881260 RepID=UPI000A839E5C|nr:hypothetical protein [Enterobacter bugandensis]
MNRMLSADKAVNGDATQCNAADVPVITDIKKITALNQFTVTFLRNKSASGAMIYANGQNQVEVQISVDFMMSDGKGGNTAAYLDKSVFLQNLSLYDSTGHPLIPDGSPAAAGMKLHYSASGGDYTNAVEYGPAVITAGETGPEYPTTCTLFVSAEDGAAYSNTIYARLDNLNKDIQVFKEGYVDTSGNFSEIGRSERIIRTIKKIDYKKAESWRAPEYTPWDESKGNVPVQSRQKIDIQWHDGDSALSRYRKCYVSIATKQTPGGQALTLSKRSISGKTTYAITEQPGGEFGTEASASSIFGWGYNDDHYDVIAWFVEPSLPDRHLEDQPWVGFSANGGLYCYLQAFNHYYRICFRSVPQDRVAEHYDVIRDDSITLYQWDIRYANTKIYQDGWSDYSEDSVVAVTDNYGNSGAFRMSFPTDHWDAVVHFDQ